MLKSVFLSPIKKNPAYGRQSISQPMRIVAPMPQEGGPRIHQNPIFLKTEKIIQNAKTQKCVEICQNQRYALRPEVSNPSGSVVSGWTKNTQKPNFFEKREKSSKTQKLKNFQRYAKSSDTPFDQRSLIHREAWFPPCFVRQNQQQKKLFFARRFLTIFKQKCSNLRPLLDSESLKILDIRLWEVGAKRRLTGTSKVNRHTHRRTFQLIESIGPEGRCFEK